MTVLIPPRIYFRGGTSWNVATTNNNDQWPTYDFPVAALNWDYLKTQSVNGVAITPDNYRQLFPQWVLTKQTYNSDNGDGTTTSWEQPPSEWNYWGGNTSSFIQSTSGGTTTTISGGQTRYGSDPSNPPIITNDPLVGLPIQILGNTSGSGPRLVDVNPDAFWCSQIYLGGLQIGDPSNAGAPWLTGSVPQGMRMHSRTINFQRNLNTDGQVEIAGVGGCVFQIGLPTASVVINNPNGASSLLTALASALSNADVQGLQLRIFAYLTKYWASEEILAAIPDLAECLKLPSKEPSGSNFVNQMISCQYDKLLALWDQKPGTQNPAITKIVGVVGVWDNDEPSTVPWQRYLPSFIDPALLGAGFAPNPLGCTDARIDTCARVLTLDFGNTTPETGSSGEKYDLGDIRVGIESGGALSNVGTLTFSDYNTAAYERSSGILDLAIPDGVPLEGRVVLQAQEDKLYRGSSSTDFVVAASESADQLVVQTDQRGVYVEQAEIGVMQLDVLYNGPAPKARTVYVTVAQYLPLPIPPGANGGAWQRVGTTLDGQSGPREPVAYFPTPGGPSQLLTMQVVLDSSGYGQASFAFAPLEPGFPTYVFFPHTDLNTTPDMPDQIAPVAPGLTTLNAFYGCARIMPFDDDLPAEFAALWNRTHDEDLAYAFVDERIFGSYAVIYPIMAGIVGTKQSLISNNAGIQARTAVGLIDDTAYMPVTRELSAGKRKVISMWGQLVDNGFSPSFNFSAGADASARTAARVESRDERQ